MIFGVLLLETKEHLDDFATHIDKKELSFRHPYIYTGMIIAAVGVMIANKHYGFGLY